VKRILLLSALLLLSAAFVFSIDYGLLADQELELTNHVSSYTPAITPWFSWDSERMSVYVSSIFTLKYYSYDSEMADSSGWVKPVLRPELSYCAMKYRIDQKYSLEAGRIEYTDVMGFTATELFDGLRFKALTPVGTINAGTFYTGFLYKETAEILMTTHDTYQYARAWNGDFDSYAASRRAFTAVRWDMPIGEDYTLSAESLFQFDLNNTDDILHSQYGEVQMVLCLPNMPELTAGLLFEAMEYKDRDFTVALGALARARMDVPGPLKDQLSAAIKLSSGWGNDTFTAVIPISARAQGMVFSETISGLASFSTDYTVRILDSLLAGGSLRYFARTYNEPASKGYLYGGEAWASVAWQPYDDIRLTLGGGAFFPGLGNIYPDGTDLMWKVIVGLSLSF